jgi:hypothetical protein
VKHFFAPLDLSKSTCENILQLNAVPTKGSLKSKRRSRETHQRRSRDILVVRIGVTVRQCKYSKTFFIKAMIGRVKKIGLCF